jgi:hypothetical protein
MTDQTKFFTDHPNHPWHLNNPQTHFYLCRQTPTGTWENALLYHLTNYPPQEITDPHQGEVANAATRLWLTPQDWQPYYHAPTHSPQEGTALFKLYLLKTMYHNIPNPLQKLNNLIQLAKGKTHTQFLQHLQNLE